MHCPISRFRIWSKDSFLVLQANLFLWLCHTCWKVCLFIHKSLSFCFCDRECKCLFTNFDILEVASLYCTLTRWSVWLLQIMGSVGEHSPGNSHQSSIHHRQGWLNSFSTIILFLICISCFKSSHRFPSKYWLDNSNSICWASNAVLISDFHNCSLSTSLFLGQPFLKQDQRLLVLSTPILSCPGLQLHGNIG